MRSLSGEALAAICGVSRSTVLRLCQKLGYQGYAEFKYALQHETEHPAQTRPADALPTQNVLTYYCSGMLQMEPLVTSDALRDFADTLSHANRVVALGLNHSSVSAEQLAFRLNKFGVDCHMLWDDARMASYERVLKQGDVVVIFPSAAGISTKRWCPNIVKSRQSGPDHHGSRQFAVPSGRYFNCFAFSDL